MKYADINKRFTEVVAEYIVKGYAINTMTMRGHQGEISKVDMTNGKEIIRIMLNNTNDYNNHLYGIELVVGRATGRAKPHMNDDWATVWNKELEVLTSEMFYQIGERGSDYYGTAEEAKAAEQTRYERYWARCEGNVIEITSAPALAIAERIVREKMGYVRVNRKEIRLTKSRKTRKYSVSYHGKTYFLR